MSNDTVERRLSMEKITFKGRRFCPICHGDYPPSHWHFKRPQ
ncbi:MAG TPA: hypothetical protein VMV84_03840 [Dehalococcoidales bacterium]|nr:hypothetical protein [Dehalococcoidales bacterium]